MNLILVTWNVNANIANCFQEDIGIRRESSGNIKKKNLKTRSVITGAVTSLLRLTFLIDTRDFGDPHHRFYLCH